MPRVHHAVDVPTLVAAGLSPALAEFVLHHPRDGVFAYWCGEDASRWPEDVPWSYTTPPAVDDVYPLWNRDADQVAMWTRDAQREFVWLFHDDPEPRRISRSEQGLLADLFVTLAENTEAEGELDRETRLRMAAKVIGFHGIDRVLRFVASSPADYFEARAALIASFEAE